MSLLTFDALIHHFGFCHLKSINQELAPVHIIHDSFLLWLDFVVYEIESQRCTHRVFLLEY